MSYGNLRNKRIAQLELSDAVRALTLSSVAPGPPEQHMQNIEAQIRLVVAVRNNFVGFKYRTPLKAIHGLSARRKEIKMLHKAIGSCTFNNSVVPSSTTPWQLGHVYLLRDLAVQDLETSREQRKALGEILKLVKRYQSDA